VAQSAGQLYIALDNCVHQVVLCGPEPVVDRLVAVLTPKGAFARSCVCARVSYAVV